MKSLRKVAFVLMVALTMMLHYDTVRAADINEVSVIHQEEDDTIVKRVNTVCGGLPYHKMKPHGWGTVIVNGSTYIDRGALWQCDNCHLILVTQGDYYMGSMSTIGRWATLPYPETVTSTITYINPPSSYGYTSDNYLNGYKFFIN